MMCSILEVRVNQERWGGEEKEMSQPHSDHRREPLTISILNRHRAWKTMVFVD